ncbi:SAM-dependent methyltransferase [Actinopolymorpha alba]|uniref:SAM-dependent methyltransferase n=1 Tax=Actinopolymorpha alba TaxID=533267 RepID=UPI000370CB6D|nr:methyltransferase domain-containing protein [Actinopolymorpha alba]
MPMTDDELRERLTLARYPRSSAYPHRWVYEHAMGPNPLWLAEALAEVMALEPGMRVLDMGCGKAITSIFLAKEFGVKAWATDLWIKPTDNWQRIREQGLHDQVFPIYAEAHDLPFAEGFFDALVSIDSYHYFGTDELYLSYYARFVRPGGQIGIVVPGHRVEPESDPAGFHGPEWWRRHWETSGAVTVETADLLPHGWDDWLLWNTVGNQAYDQPDDSGDIPMLRADGGRSLGFTRLVARSSAE